jgi:hypothetical protein
MAARGHEARECGTVGGFIDGRRAQVKTASVFTRSVSAESRLTSSSPVARFAP